MKENCEPVFSPEQFFELENACDLVEHQLRLGDSPDIEEIVAKASYEIRRVLRQEIDLLLDEYQRLSSNETINPQSCTLSPDPWDTKRKRVARFESNSIASAKEGNDEQEVKLEHDNVFGRFQLHSVVGRGGSGTVWRAYDANLDRWVALKISHPRSNLDAKRFVREAQAVAQLKHPGIIPVFEAGELEGRCYLVSEFCFGQPLSLLIKQGVDLERAVEIVLAIIDAVEHSHQMGIVHRDIKPHNVMISTDGVPMVTDFGLARNLQLDQTLTREGELIGTPGYMAPEQAKGGGVPCDERTDIYSIGVVLYQLLAGQLPFTGSFERVIFQVINTVPPFLDSINSEIPNELSAICAKCLEKSPERRYQTATELGEELRRFIEGEPVETRKVGFAGRYVRWLQREPRIAWLATGCGLLLIMTTIGSTWSAYSLGIAWRKEKEHLVETKMLLAEAVEARQQEGQARQNAEIAERLAKEMTTQIRQLARSSRQEADFLTTLLAPVDIIGVNQMHPGGSQGTHLLSAETIEAATVQVNRMMEAPRVQARVKGMLANAWRSLGRFEKAKSLLFESTQLLNSCKNFDEQLLGDRGMNQLYWAYWHHHNDELVEAEMHYRQAIELHQQSVDASGQSTTCLLQLAQAEFGLGALFLRQRLNAKAEPLLFRALETRRKYLPEGDSLLMATELAFVQCKPETTEVDLAKLLTTFDQDIVKRGMKLYWVIEKLRRKKAYDDAIVCYEDLISLISTSIGKDNALYVMAIGDFASLQRQAGNYREAFQLIETAIDRSAELSRWHSARMGAMMILESELILAERYQEARELLLEVSKHRLPRWNDSNRLHLDLAWCHFHLGEFELAVDHSRPPLRSIGSCTAAETAWFCHTHATMLAAAGQTSEAETFHQKAIETVEKMVRDEDLPDHSTWLQRCGAVLTYHGRAPQAEELFRRAIEVAKQEYTNNHPRVAGLKVVLAENLLQQKKLLVEAKQLLTEALQIHEVSLPATDKRIDTAKMLLDQVLVANTKLPDPY